MNKTLENFLDIFHSINFQEIEKHPNILIAANFWDEERYKAAKTCYRFMRYIDDMIDDYKSIHQRIEEKNKIEFEKEVTRWISEIKNRSNGLDRNDDFLNTIQQFRIPVWPFEDFARSMIYDIHQDGFRSMASFLDYSRGASIAPASVFVHLCGISKHNGRYMEPAYQVRETATPCAIFSYLVHIIRDFQKDQVSNLNYFADDMMTKYGLSEQDLKNMAQEGNVNEGFRGMVSEYCAVAEEYKLKTFEMIRKISPYLGPRYQLSLEIIFNLYLIVFERIDLKNGKFTAAELNPSIDEIRDRVHDIILNFQSEASHQASQVVMEKEFLNI